MKILIAEKNKNLVSALMLVISQIKRADVKEIGDVLNVNTVHALFEKLKIENPDVLIINGGFVNHKTRDMLPALEELYPIMTILILSTDPGLEEKYVEVGIEDFILKGNSAASFYNSMVTFLKKEQKKLLSNSKV